MKLMKKANITGVQGFIMGIVGVGILLAIGLIVLGELQTSTHQCVAADAVYNASSRLCVGTTDNTTSAAFQATGEIITKLATVPTWIGIMITVALAFIVLGYFYSRN